MSNKKPSNASKSSNVVTRSKAEELSSEKYSAQLIQDECKECGHVQTSLDSHTCNSPNEDMLTRIERKLEKLEVLDKLSASVDNISKVIRKLDEKMKKQEERLQSFEDALQHNVSELTEVKENLSSKVNLDYITKLEDKIDDLENRSRRNNIILHNIPESEENPNDCASFVEDLITTFFEMKGVDGNTIVVERAHRGKTVKKDAPRPIYVKILNWRNTQLLLQQGPKILRSKVYKEEQKIFITDDVSFKEREKRKSLLPQRNELRKQGLFAYIPFRVPAVLVYKDKSNQFRTVFPLDPLIR